MNKFIITTENTCAMPSDFLKNLNVGLIYMHFFSDGTELPREYDLPSFYSSLRSGAKISTSQATEYDFAEVWKPMLEDGFDILHIGFSSALSCTYVNSLHTVEKYSKKFPDRKILVVDSFSASNGQGLFVKLVSDYKNEGHSLEECFEYAKTLRYKINHLFTVDNLKSLISTGRVSNAEAFLGTLLQIKPLLYIDDLGNLVPFGRVTGRKSSLTALADKTLQNFSGENRTIYIGHGDCLEDAQVIAEKLSSLNANIEFYDIGPIIASHTGAGVVSVFFVGNSRAVK